MNEQPAELATRFAAALHKKDEKLALELAVELAVYTFDALMTISKSLQLLAACVEQPSQRNNFKPKFGVDNDNE